MIRGTVREGHASFVRLPMWRHVSVDECGELHCRKCGGTRLRCKVRERGRSTKHLTCAACGARQVFREPGGHASESPGSEAGEARSDTLEAGEAEVSETREPIHDDPGTDSREAKASTAGE